MKYCDGVRLRRLYFLPNLKIETKTQTNKNGFVKYNEIKQTSPHYFKTLLLCRVLGIRIGETAGLGSFRDVFALGSFRIVSPERTDTIPFPHPQQALDRPKLTEQTE